MRARALPALVLLALLAGCGDSSGKPGTAAKAATDPATIPLYVEGNRPYLVLTLQRADGTRRTARFLVDSGGGAFLLSEPLAKDVGLTWGETMREDGMEMAIATAAPKVSVDRFPLELDPKRTLVVLRSDSVLPPGAPARADGFLPGHVLARYHVVFDYPGATFTIARTGVLKPKGDALPMPVGKSSGFPRTELEIDGHKHGFLLDTGASFTMVSETLLKAWGTAHPDWERHPGAYGEAKTLGGMTLETMFVPAATWGANALTKVGVVSQREGTFEQRMSSLMAAPIEGSLAGNVLKAFRVEMDYPNEKLYLSKP